MRVSLKLLLLISDRGNGAGGNDHDTALDTGLVSLSLDFTRQRHGYQTTAEAYARVTGISLLMDFTANQYVV